MRSACALVDTEKDSAPLRLASSQSTAAKLRLANTDKIVAFLQVIIIDKRIVNCACVDKVNLRCAYESVILRYRN